MFYLRRSGWMGDSMIRTTISSWNSRKAGSSSSFTPRLGNHKPLVSLIIITRRIKYYSLKLLLLDCPDANMQIDQIISIRLKGSYYITSFKSDASIIVCYNNSLVGGFILCSVHRVVQQVLVTTRNTWRSQQLPGYLPDMHSVNMELPLVKSDQTLKTLKEKTP